MPKVRMNAVRSVLFDGWGIRKAARRLGMSPSTVSRWVKRDHSFGWKPIPTLSSRPHHHPRELSPETTKAIIDCRIKYRRCAEVTHHLLMKEGIRTSLSSVKRTLRRHGFTNHSRWKKWHKYPPRPAAERPGILVQIDTIWTERNEDRLYVYTLLDVCSRWGFALPMERINTHKSLAFVKDAQNEAPFGFQTLQSDHGSEFSKWFTKRIGEYGLAHRHSRIRTPSDNGHLERFNRTIQEECLNRVPRSLRSWKKEIPEYLAWYNTKRPHMALQMKTPNEVLRSY